MVWRINFRTDKNWSFIHSNYFLFVFAYLGMLVSIPFIFATFSVYLFIPELRNVHGKCLLAYLMGLMIGYVSLSMLQLNVISCKQISFLGYLVYFSFVSAFMWLNIISFDACWAFRYTWISLSFQDPNRYGWFTCSTLNSNKKIWTQKSFIWYMIYAWGLSLLLTCAVFVLNTSEFLPDEFRPSIGTEKCFFDGKNYHFILLMRSSPWHFLLRLISEKHKKAQFVFYYLPLLISAIVNAIFFFVTAFKIRSTQNDLNKIKSKENGSGSAREQRKWQKDKDK